MCHYLLLSNAIYNNYVCCYSSWKSVCIDITCTLLVECPWSISLCIPNMKHCFNINCALLYACCICRFKNSLRACIILSSCRLEIKLILSYQQDDFLPQICKQKNTTTFANENLGPGWYRPQQYDNTCSYFLWKDVMVINSPNINKQTATSHRKSLHTTHGVGNSGPGFGQT